MDKWSRAIWIKGAAGIAGAVMSLFGGWDALFRALIVLMAADYVSGILVAVMGKSPKTDYGGLSSKAGAKGLARKGLMLLVVLAATLTDEALGTQAHMARDAACWFYIANEALSILENAGLAGAPYPASLKRLLGQKLAEEGENEDAE